MNLLLQLIANGIVNAGLYAMLAVGFGIILRSLRVIHIAYGGFFVSSSYFFYVLATHTQLPLWWTFILTLMFSIVTGWIADITLYGPFQRKGASPEATLIASLGVSIVLENLISLVFGNTLKYIHRGTYPSHRFGPIILTDIQILQIIVSAVTIILVWLMTRRLRLFKALWALGDQPELVSALGLPGNALRCLSLIIGTTLAAIPATLICFDIGVDPHVGMSYFLIAAVAVLVGGIDSFAGWVLGASVLAILQSVVVWKLSTRWMDFATFLLLIAMLSFRPSGLLTRYKRLEEIP